MYIAYINYVCNTTVLKIVLCMMNFYLHHSKNEDSNTNSNLKSKSEGYPFNYIQFTTETCYIFVMALTEKHDLLSGDGTTLVKLGWNECTTILNSLVQNIQLAVALKMRSSYKID